MKKKIAITLFILAVLFAWGRYAYYGSLTRSCIYTERNIPVPQHLATGKITTIQKSYQVKGIDASVSCLPVLGKITRHLIGPETISNVAVGTGYYTRGGRTVEDVPKEKKFSLVQILEVTKHGIFTMDSGSGPLYYLVLIDEKGERFKVATTSTGLNKKGRFLQYTSPQDSFVLDPGKFAFRGSDR